MLKVIHDAINMYFRAIATTLKAFMACYFFYRYSFWAMLMQIQRCFWINNRSKQQSLFLEKKKEKMYIHLAYDLIKLELSSTVKYSQLTVHRFHVVWTLGRLIFPINSLCLKPQCFHQSFESEKPNTCWTTFQRPSTYNVWINLNGLLLEWALGTDFIIQIW